MYKPGTEFEELQTEFDRGYLAAIDNVADTLMLANRQRRAAITEANKSKQLVSEMYTRQRRLSAIVFIEACLIALLLIHAFGPVLLEWLQ